MIYYSCNIASSPPTSPSQPTRVSCLLSSIVIEPLPFLVSAFVFLERHSNRYEAYFEIFELFALVSLNIIISVVVQTAPSLQWSITFPIYVFWVSRTDNTWMLFLSIFWLLLPIILMKRSTIINYSGSELWPTSRAPSPLQSASNMMILKPIVFILALLFAHAYFKY